MTDYRRTEDRSSILMNNLECRYRLTTIAGKKGEIYAYDDDRKGIMINFAPGRYLNLRNRPSRGMRDDGDAVILSVDEALTMATEILDIIQMYFFELQGFKKCDITPMLKRSGRKRENYQFLKNRKDMA